jgi:hypothetical protein
MSVKVQLITTGKNDGLILTLAVLPQTGDTFELDQDAYRVHRVLHKITSPLLRGTDDFDQRIALVLEKL